MVGIPDDIVHHNCTSALPTPPKSIGKAVKKLAALARPSNICNPEPSTPPCADLSTTSVEVFAISCISLELSVSCTLNSVIALRPSSTFSFCSLVCIASVVNSICFLIASGFTNVLPDANIWATVIFCNSTPSSSMNFLGFSMASIMSCIIRSNGP